MSYYPDEMVCAVCDRPLSRWDRYFADCWMDPNGVACVAHRGCLRRLGEVELGLLAEDAGSGLPHERPEPA